MRPSRRRLTEQGADLAARNERLIAERDAALEEASAHKAAAETSSRLYVEADEKYVDTCLVNEALTTDLTKARERLAEYGGRRTVAEVLEEHDVHRKALADALGEQKRHLNWDALIGEVGSLAGDLAATRRELAAVRKVEGSLARQIHEMAQPVEPSDEEVDAAQLRLELDQAEARVTHLEKELDNALGMPASGILTSAQWQPGYQDPKPDTKASAS